MLVPSFNCWQQTTRSSSTTLWLVVYITIVVFAVIRATCFDQVPHVSICWPNCVRPKLDRAAFRDLCVKAPTFPKLTQVATLGRRGAKSNQAVPGQTTWSEPGRILDIVALHVQALLSSRALTAFIAHSTRSEELTVKARKFKKKISSLWRRMAATA